MSDNLDESRRLIGSLQSLRVIDFLKSGGEYRKTIAAEIERLCQIFRHVAPVERAELASLVRPGFSFAFFWFARAMAEKAVRECSQTAICDGLTALVIENCTFDARDTMLRLALLYHSAAKLKLDVETLFALAADLGVSPETAKIVREFPQRPPDARDLEAFRYEESGAGDRFVYRKQGGEELPF
jgi:hypothetical protein